MKKKNDIMFAPSSDLNVHVKNRALVEHIREVNGKLTRDSQSGANSKEHAHGIALSERERTLAVIGSLGITEAQRDRSKNATSTYSY